MMLTARGVALLQQEQSLDLLEERLRKAGSHISWLEGALRKRGLRPVVKFSHSPSHDFELVARRDGMALGHTQRTLAKAMFEIGMSGRTQDGPGWSAVMFDLGGFRFAVIWPEEKEG